jgi:hypothetical protein
MSILQGEFWKQPSVFLQQALDLINADVTILIAQLDGAPIYQAYIAVGILSNNPTAHQSLQSAEGLHERLRERFDRLPAIIRNQAWQIIQHATGTKEMETPPQVAQTIPREKNLETGRKTLAKLRELLAEEMRSSPSVAEAARHLERTLETKYAPQIGTTVPPRVSEPRKKPVKPSDEVKKNEEVQTPIVPSVKSGQTSMVDFS